MILWLGAIAALGGPPAEQASRIELEWHGEACHEAERTRARLRELLPAHEAGPRGRARVTIVPDGGAPRDGHVPWRVTLAIGTDDGTVTRTIRGGPCSSLTEAIALVIAVTVDPLGTSLQVKPQPPAVAEPEQGMVPEPEQGAVPEQGTALEQGTVPELVGAPPAVDGRAATRAEPEVGRTRDDRSPPRPRSVLAIAEAGGALGLLPPLGARLGGTVVLGIGAARLAVTGLHVLARRVEHPQDPSVGADIALSSARVSAGWSFVRGRFALPLYAGLEAGVFTAAGFGLQRTATPRATWLAVVPHAQPTLWATPWLGVGVHLEVPIALTRPRFGVDDFSGDLAQVPAVGLRCGLGITFKIFDESRRMRRMEGSG